MFNKPLFSPHNCHSDWEEINLWIPVKKKLGLGVCPIQITTVRCCSGAQWPCVFIVGPWSMNWRIILPCASQNINSVLCTGCENALHIQYSYQTLHLAVVTSVYDWSSIDTYIHTYIHTYYTHTHTRTRTHTHTHTHIFHIFNICQLTVEYEKVKIKTSHMHEWHNKHNRHDTRVKECSTIQFTLVKQ
jgi:hypothetical protein